ncbi:MAG TPA: hypothetical protein VK140_17490 [Ktedonobacteraceae bacterium]|nr:hypothetical protein [Ktedonobacteraceae bacterium]
MAPRLSKLIVYEAPNTTQGYNDEFARIVSDRTPVISVSWGDCEKNMGQQEVQRHAGPHQDTRKGPHPAPHHPAPTRGGCCPGPEHSCRCR